MPIDVELTLAEMTVAKEVAWCRIVASASQRLNHATTYKRTMAKRLAEEFVGTCGEIAVAKVHGVFFVPSVNTFHEVPDFMRDIEVRATDNEGGCLIVRSNDDSDRKFVLAVMTGGSTVSLIGWATGAEAKDDRWLRNPNGYREAWFVPQSCLRPVEELIECHAKPA